MPWRATNNPYHIYISEIVFQQTRIDQGLKYYQAIIKKYPGFIALSKAGENDFLSIWQGLGYYSRAHNVLRTAAIVANEWGGRLPETFNDLKSLPGIGPYTAAAIASIAFGQPCPVVDGNVKRVMSRLFCIEIPVDKSALTAEIEQILNRHISHHQPADFNQSLMELGALVCTPANPECNNCPLQKHCCAFSKNSMSRFPVKAQPKVRPKAIIHYFVIFADTERTSFYMIPRNNEKIWKGLYEFPYIEDNKAEVKINSAPCDFPAAFPFKKAQNVYTANHELSHRQIKASFHEIDFSGTVPPHWEKISLSKARKIPVHKLIQSYLINRRIRKK